LVREPPDSHRARLLPMVELIERSRTAVAHPIDVLESTGVCAVPGLSAGRAAGEPRQFLEEENR
jgi:hypothetical protein